ncbi:MAG: FAD:protein FMN transferase [Actinobacteria bacterium]|nr:FAD:protein FMN transferase [Actinomycetota bacterium]
MHAQREFRVMGTTAHVLVEAATVEAAETGVAHAQTRLLELERRWSRFVDHSDVSVLNAAHGAPVIVHPDTRLLVERAVEGWHRTDGRFDPTVLDAMCAIGYDRDFDAIDRDSPDPVPTTIPAPGCAGIVVDRVVGAVRLPRGVRFDPGGIGKGLAADLVAEELMRAGAHGVLVNVGGDLRVEGRAPGAGGWVIDLAHPITGESITHLHVAGGAVASTWRTKRTWGPAGDERHHLVDPATGAPAYPGLAGTAVLAAQGWWAEVLAKAAFVDGPERGRAALERHHVSGYLVADDGGVQEVGRTAARAA